MTLEDDTLMQWCVDNDFCGEAAKAVRYDSDFVWEGEPWPAGEYIVSEKDRNAMPPSDIFIRENLIIQGEHLWAFRNWQYRW